MAIESRDQLKTYFETGDIPTESEFCNVFDSTLNFISDSVTIIRPPAYSVPRFGFAVPAPSGTVSAAGTGANQSVFGLHDVAGTARFQLDLGPVSPGVDQNNGLLFSESVGGVGTPRAIIEIGTGNMGVGTVLPDERLHVKGTVKTDGFIMSDSPTDGYVLTSDGAGRGTWQPASGGGSTFWAAGSGKNSIIADNGSGNTATGDHGLAFGNANAAAGVNSMAMGQNSAATGENSLAAGANVKASADAAVAFGVGTFADGKGAAAFGAESMASGPYSLAVGEKVRATGESSFATGGDTEAAGPNSVSTGSQTIAVGNAAFANGVNTRAEGEHSATFGSLTTAFKSGAIATGLKTSAEGEYSFTGGFSKSDVPVTAGALAAFNFSCNSGEQKKGRGAFGDCSAILGGMDHHVVPEARNSVVLGGESLTGTHPNHVFVPNLAIAKIHQFNDDSEAQKAVATGAIPSGSLYIITKRPEIRIAL